MFDLIALQPVLDTAFDAVVIMDAAGLIIDWNRRAEDTFGWSRQDVLGLALGEIIVPPRFRDAHRRGMARFLASGEATVLGRLLELSALRRDQSEFPIELSITAVGPVGAPVFLGFMRDISERREVVARLAASEARFRAIADAAPAPVWMTSVEGGVEFANQAFAEFAGLDRDALLGDVWVDLIHGQDIPAVLEARAAARSQLLAYRFEARFRHQSGVYRWMLASAKPRFDGHGQFQGYLGMAMDLTDIKLSEARQRLLINELNHRVKNTLSSIQSIARQTLRPDETPLHVRDRFVDRLLAMSAAHDVLTRESWEAAPIDEIVRQSLRPFIDRQDLGRITIAGPALRLGSSAALALALAIHELGTNAVKYGALSTPSGRIAILWEQIDESHGRMRWQEIDGPTVQPPSRKGFGSRLLDGGLSADLGGRPQLLFMPEGIEALLPMRLAAGGKN